MNDNSIRKCQGNLIMPLLGHRCADAVLIKYLPPRLKKYKQAHGRDNRHRYLLMV